MTEEQLSALLRLKRHEQPPPGYFDDLLHAVHRRQREELLQRSLWRIALERWQTFFSVHSMGTLSYAGAMAGVLAVGLVGVSVLTPGPAGRTGEQPLVASNEKAEAASSPQAVAGSASSSSSPQRITLDRLVNGGQVQLAKSKTMPVSGDPAEAGRNAPRYVIDARPVSYAPSFSF